MSNVPRRPTGAAPSTTGGLGLPAAVSIGVGGMIVAAAAVAAFNALRRRRGQRCSIEEGQVPIELGQRSR